MPAKLRLHLLKRARPRRAPPREDAAAVFKTFVETLARLRAHARDANAAHMREGAQ